MHDTRGAYFHPPVNVNIPHFFRLIPILIVSVCLTHPSLGAAAPGVPVTYQLPSDGPLPQTYRVTLAIVDPKNPEWIVSQFAAGVARTVTKENGGKFSELWDGLDDNFMPVPPGEYAVKGIFMPAKKWVVDGEWHSITPRFVTGASSWMPTPEQWDKPDKWDKRDKWRKRQN